MRNSRLTVIDNLAAALEHLRTRRLRCEQSAWVLCVALLDRNQALLAGITPLNMVYLKLCFEILQFVL